MRICLLRYWLLITSTVVAIKGNDYLLEKDISENMEIAEEMPISLITDCVLKCEMDARCKTPGIKRNKKGEITACLFFRYREDANKTIKGDSSSVAVLHKVTNETEMASNPNHLKTGACKCCWVRQAATMCFGAKDDRYGEFKTTQTGKLYGLKFIYRGGAVYCARGHFGYWGCPFFNKDHISVFITDEANKIIFPLFAIGKVKFGDEDNYFIKGASSSSKELILERPDSKPLSSVKEGQKLKVWYMEDFANYGEKDGNSGETCAEVYAKYEC